MSDFRALCQELMDAIDSGIPVERIKQSPLAVRVDAALAQPKPQEPTDLSPAAQAVITASNCAGSRIVQLHIAAALRAAADQVYHHWDGAECVDYLLAIAAELEIDHG